MLHTLPICATPATCAQLHGGYFVAPWLCPHVLSKHAFCTRCTCCCCVCVVLPAPHGWLRTPLLLCLSLPCSCSSLCLFVCLLSPRASPCVVWLLLCSLLRLWWDHRIRLALNRRGHGDVLGSLDEEGSFRTRLTAGTSFASLSPRGRVQNPPHATLRYALLCETVPTCVGRGDGGGRGCVALVSVWCLTGTMDADIDGTPTVSGCVVCIPQRNGAPDGPASACDPCPALEGGPNAAANTASTVLLVAGGCVLRHRLRVVEETLRLLGVLHVACCTLVLFSISNKHAVPPTLPGPRGRQPLKRPAWRWDRVGSNILLCKVPTNPRRRAFMTGSLELQAPSRWQALGLLLKVGVRWKPCPITTKRVGRQAAGPFCLELWRSWC